MTNGHRIHTSTYATMGSNWMYLHVADWQQDHFLVRNADIPLDGPLLHTHQIGPNHVKGGVQSWKEYQTKYASMSHANIFLSGHHLMGPHRGHQVPHQRKVFFSGPVIGPELGVHGETSNLVTSWQVPIWGVMGSLGWVLPIWLCRPHRPWCCWARRGHWTLSATWIRMLCSALRSGQCLWHM